MILQLALSTMMVLITAITHGLGIAILAKTLRGELREEREHHLRAFSFRALAFTLALMFGLFVLHGIEIWSYALLYEFLGAVENLETAVYFSTISYSGVGFDDRYMAEGWRLISAIEGINGLLLLGWSTAFFVTVVTRMGRR